MFAALQVTVGIVTMCLPPLAKAGVEFFIMGRVMLGLAQVNYSFKNYFKYCCSIGKFQRGLWCHQYNLWWLGGLHFQNEAGIQPSSSQDAKWAQYLEPFSVV